MTRREPDLVHDRGRQQVIAPCSRFCSMSASKADRADRMLVDGIMMIHVELHLRAATRPKSGTKRPNTPTSVHPAQHRFGVARTGQRRGTAHFARAMRRTPILDQLRIMPRLAHRLWMDFEAMLVGERKNLDQPHRILLEEIIGRQREPAAVEHETVELARSPPDRRRRRRPRAAIWSSRCARKVPVTSPTALAWIDRAA